MVHALKEKVASGRRAENQQQLSWRVTIMYCEDKGLGEWKLLKEWEDSTVYLAQKRTQ